MRTSWNKGTKGIVKAWNKGLHNIYSKSTLKKMSLAKKGKPSPRKGVKLSMEQIEKLRKAHLGKKLSEEHRRKIGKALTGKKRPKEVGRKISSAKKLKNLKGSKSNMWKNGRINQKGYIKIYAPYHPHNSFNYVFEHRLIMEKYLGRHLTPKEIVHHINEDPSDNRIENLMLFKNAGKHLNFHIKINKLKSNHP